MFEDKKIEEVIRYFGCNVEKGLTQEEAARLLKLNGRNEMKAARKKTLLESFFKQLNDPLIYVLIAAAVVSVILKEVSDAVIIGVVVFMNAIVGMVQEGKAQKALDSLKKTDQPEGSGDQRREQNGDTGSRTGNGRPGMSGSRLPGAGRSASDQDQQPENRRVFPDRRVSARGEGSMVSGERECAFRRSP